MTSKKDINPEDIFESKTDVTDNAEPIEIEELERPPEEEPPEEMSGIRLHMWYWSAWVSSRTRRIKSKFNFTVGVWLPTWLMNAMFRANNAPLMIKQFDGDRHPIRVQEAQIIALPKDHTATEDLLMERVKSPKLSRKRRKRKNKFKEIHIQDKLVHNEPGMVEVEVIDTSSSVTTESSSSVITDEIEMDKITEGDPIVVKHITTPHKRWLATQRLFWFMRKCEPTIDGFSDFIHSCLPYGTSSETHDIFVKIKYIPEDHEKHNLIVKLDSGRFDLETIEKDFNDKKFLFGRFTLPSKHKVESMAKVPDENDLNILADECLANLEDAFGDIDFDMDDYDFDSFDGDLETEEIYDMDEEPALPTTNFTNGSDSENDNI